jgi:hypothetical protein
MASSKRLAPARFLNALQRRRLTVVALGKLIDFRRKDEIVLGKAVDCVRGKFEADDVIKEVDVRMVLFGFGDFGDLIDEFHRVLEVFELHFFKQPEIVHVFPSGKFPQVFDNSLGR